MPVHPTYPGVYVQEIPSGLHTISAVATSTAAFIGTFAKGLANEAVEILSMADFEREYGGLQRNSEATYAIQQFFLNGGTDAYVVRVGHDGSGGATAMAAASAILRDGTGGALANITAGRRIRGHSATNPGDWGNFLRVEIALNDSSTTSTFNLYVSEVSIDGDRTSVVRTETFNNLTFEPNTANNALEVVNQGSRLVQLDRNGLGALPSPAPVPAPTGTISGPLSALPAAAPTISVMVMAGNPATLVGKARLTFPTAFVAPTSWMQWAQLFQTAIRSALNNSGDTTPNPALPTALQPYLTGASVDLIGDGSVGNPRRFVIHAGTGARPFDPTARLVFSGGGFDEGTPVLGYGATATPDAHGSFAGTVDLVAVPVPTAGVLTLNGQNINIAAGDAPTVIRDAINAVTPATNVSATVDVGNHIVLADTDFHSFTIGGTALTDLGLPAGTATPPNLGAQLDTKTLQIKVGGNPALTINFAKGVAPETFSDLPAALSALVGGTATVDANRNISVYSNNGTDPIDFTGTSPGVLAAFGLHPAAAGGTTSFTQQLVLSGGHDGDVINNAQAYVVPEAVFAGSAVAKTGLYALEAVDLFNILCIPDAPRLSATDTFALYTLAENYVEGRRAMLIVDIPDAIKQIDQMQTWMADNDALRNANAAVYFPRTYIPDPLNQNRPRSIAASGTIAGLWARTDTNRGVWKAPAGTEAQLRNVNSLAYVMTDLENGTLNPLGINCLRSFPVYSNICWGARTLDGADLMASDWKYVPVRRTTLFLEESLFRGTKWVVFEPNDEPLWAQIRLNVGAFMQDMFRKGAFQGSMPRDAYFVKCDGDTTTQQDIDNGIVNIQVGFAPLKPAEFVILSIQQIVRNTGA